MCRQFAHGDNTYGSSGGMGKQNVPKSGASSVGWMGCRLTVEVDGVIADLCRGVAKLVKASDFDSDMRGFESFLPCQISHSDSRCGQNVKAHAGAEPNGLHEPRKPRRRECAFQHRALHW